jgi:hypothetical protein
MNNEILIVVPQINEFVIVTQSQSANSLQINDMVIVTPSQGLEGSQGDKGDKGDKGEQGIQGEKGDKGDIGLTGDQGIQGEKGEQGIQGIQGDSVEKPIAIDIAASLSYALYQTKIVRMDFSTGIVTHAIITSIAEWADRATLTYN